MGSKPVLVILVLTAIGLVLLASGMVIGYSLQDPDKPDHGLSSDLTAGLEIVGSSHNTGTKLQDLELVAGIVIDKDVATLTITVETYEGETIRVKLFREYVELDTGYNVDGRWIVYSLEPGSPVAFEGVILGDLALALRVTLDDGRDLAISQYFILVEREE